MSASTLSRALVAAVALTATIAPTAVAAAATAAPPTPLAAHGPEAKPFTPGTITIDPASITDGSPEVTVTVEPGPALADPTVALDATGDVDVATGDTAVDEARSPP